MIRTHLVKRTLYICNSRRKSQKNGKNQMKTICLSTIVRNASETRSENKNSCGLFLISGPELQFLRKVANEDRTSVTSVAISWQNLMFSWKFCSKVYYISKNVMSFLEIDIQKFLARFTSCNILKCILGKASQPFINANH